MPIEPVKIPQDFQIEDRIIGPVSLRQIIIMLFGAGASYTLWAALTSTLGPNIVSGGIALIPATIAASFAFVKVNRLSLFQILLLSIEKSQKPTIRKWTPRQGIQINFVIKGSKEKKKGTKSTSLKERKEQRIEELSELLDRGPDIIGDAEEKLPAFPVEPSRVSASPATDDKAQSIDGMSDTAEAHEETRDIVRDITPSS